VWWFACLVRIRPPFCCNNSHTTGHPCTIQTPLGCEIRKYCRRRCMSHFCYDPDFNVVRCSQLRTGKLGRNLSPYSRRCIISQTRAQRNGRDDGTRRNDVTGRLFIEISPYKGRYHPAHRPQSSVHSVTRHEEQGVWPSREETGDSDHHKIIL